MLQNNEIIEKWTAKQKIDFLADFKKEANRLPGGNDFPAFSVRDLWAANKADEDAPYTFPSPASPTFGPSFLWAAPRTTSAHRFSAT